MTILLLALAAFFAGLVDSIAGGGGLISLPALLVAGVPPHVALGTNKVQSCLGTAVGAARYLRGGHLHPPTGILSSLGALGGSFLGARLALAVPGAILSKVVPFLVLAVGLFTFLRPSFGLDDRFTGAGRPGLAGAFVLGFCVGTYDGFFGPGTGTFLTFLYVLLFGLGFLRATGNAKLANLASNVAALTAFALDRQILWPIALPMAAANIAGNWLGAGLAIRRGASLIKPVFGLVLMGLLVKLVFFP
ncbi:MAG: TSUP family transporter [Bacteroidota bacterium]